MIATATSYKKAGLLGLFLWLATAALSLGMAQSPGMDQAPSLLEQLQKGGPSSPTPIESCVKM